jgi:hypothetical protein
MDLYLHSLNTTPWRGAQLQSKYIIIIIIIIIIIKDQLPRITWSL